MLSPYVTLGEGIHYFTEEQPVIMSLLSGTTRIPLFSTLRLHSMFFPN